MTNLPYDNIFVFLKETLISIICCQETLQKNSEGYKYIQMSVQSIAYVRSAEMN